MPAPCRRLLLPVFATAVTFLVLGAASLRQAPNHAEATTGAAVITTPTNGATLTGATVNFAWSPGATTTTYVLWLGSSAGASDLLDSPSTATTSLSADSLPSNGRPIYARLWAFDTSLFSWLASDSSYTAAAPTPGLATLTSPIAGATLAGSAQTFTWTAAPGATGYWLWAGSTLGGSNYFLSAQFDSSTTSSLASGLPTDGSPVFIRLYTQIGSYQPVDYVYTAAGSGGARPGVVSLVAPAAGQPNLTQTPTLLWAAPAGAVPGVTSYTVNVGGPTPSATTVGVPLATTTALSLQAPSGEGL